MSMEVMKLVWQDVGIRNEIELLSAEPFLHLYVVVAESIFSSDFVALWEVVDPLVFIKSLIHVALA